MRTLMRALVRIDTALFKQRGHLFPWAPVAMAIGIGTYWPEQRALAGNLSDHMHGCIAGWACHMALSGQLVAFWLGHMSDCAGVLHCWRAGAHGVSAGHEMALLRRG